MCFKLRLKIFLVQFPCVEVMFPLIIQYFLVKTSEIIFPMAKAFEWSCVSSTGSDCALSNFATPTATDGSGTAGAQITVAGVEIQT
jgi:hypothetical protein